MDSTPSRGFTLIELMIVVAIIGILAAVALPAYRDYIARSQAIEGVDIVAYAKTPMAEFFVNQGRWPLAVASVSGTESGKYVARLSMTNSGSTTPEMRLTAVYKTDDINPSISGKSVWIETTDGGTSWRCAHDASLPARFLPAACN